VLCLGVSPATAEITTPALTTVSPPGAEIGGAAVRLLVDVIAGQAPAREHILLAPTLFVRGSTGPASAPR
jgi:DNA-binding LacI/PurR family transcriptional regulator